eukprot:2805368-Amphidinium_carterae.2
MDNPFTQGVAASLGWNAFAPTVNGANFLPQNRQHVYCHDERGAKDGDLLNSKVLSGQNLTEVFTTELKVGLFGCLLRSTTNPLAKKKHLQALQYVCAAGPS